MHIILGALATIVTVLILVNRLSDSGLDIGWLNPFAWKRRREWDKKYHANPLYALTSPMEVTALFMVGLAKSEGEISAEQKNEIKNKFQLVFKLTEQQAVELFSASAFLLKEDPRAIGNVPKIVEASLSNFSTEQATSAQEIMTHIANLGSPADEFQRGVLEAFAATFHREKAKAGAW
jgi:hypothetical protein